MGNIGEVNRGDIEKDPYYVQGDNAGRSGVELSYEEALRGVKGVEILLRDAHGRIKGRYEEGRHDVAPVSGKNLTLSIDMDLQALGEKLMQNKRGSIVMIELKPERFWCLVFLPSYDPNLLVGRARERTTSCCRKFGQAFAGPCHHGALSAGIDIQADTGVDFPSGGSDYDRNLVYFAHGYTGARNGKPACHGHASPLNVTYALATSCNSFFCWGLRDMIDSRRRYSSGGEAFEVWKNYQVSMDTVISWALTCLGKIEALPNSEYYDKYHEQLEFELPSSPLRSGRGEVHSCAFAICNLAATIANRGVFYYSHVV